MDNLPVFYRKRYGLIVQIQSFLQEGLSKREIARRLGISRNTVTRYREGEPLTLCQGGIRRSKLAPYHDMIVECLNGGYSKSKTVKSIYAEGYTGALSTAFEYLSKLELHTGKEFAPQPYIRTHTEAMKYRSGSKGRDSDYITRAGVFRYLWTNMELSDYQRDYILKQFPVIYILKKCIKDFRRIFDKRNMPLLCLFIQSYSESGIKEISSFAKGLYRDIDAVENAVASDLSNGFVEGVNNKLKMIKRSMYGRSSRKLLCIKMTYKNKP